MSTLVLHSSARHNQNANRKSFSKPNVGGSDRLLRAILGAILLADGIYGTGPLGLDAVLIILSVPLIISAMFAWDPFYALFKVRTATLHDHAAISWKARARNANGGVNVGTMDRVCRIFVAGVLLAEPFLLPGTVGMVTAMAAFAGVIVMMTALTGWDPIYALMKIRTATLRIETAPNITQYSSDKLALIDDVVGEDEDLYQKVA